MSADRRRHLNEAHAAARRAALSANEAPDLVQRTRETPARDLMPSCADWVRTGAQAATTGWLDGLRALLRPVCPIPPGWPRRAPPETTLRGPPSEWMASPLVCAILLVATHVVCQHDPGSERERGVAALRDLSADWLRPRGLRPRAAQAVGLAFLHHMAGWILALLVTRRQLAGNAREAAMARRRL